ncbi:MAG: hypothetical protein R8M45_01180 [Ghiorsea sp.]
MKRACEHISQLASERMERDLSMFESLRLRMHFLMCSACRHYDKSLHLLHHVLKLKRHSNDEALQLPAEKRDRIKKTINDNIS